jgi:Glycosyl hydrolase family 26
VALAALSTPPAAPAASIQLGAYYCPEETCDATDGATLDAYRERFGRYPAIALNFRDLDQPLLYPGEEAGLRTRGVTPMLTVEPVVTGKREAEVAMAAIAAGHYDAEIEADARIAADFPGQILLRFAQEMNGRWFPRRSADPEAFVAAWTRYTRIFRELGAGNVAFVWTPSVEIGGAKPLEQFFPGARYVDYVGLDGYNWGRSRWRSFSEVFAASYDRLTKLSDKPVVIGETASAPGPRKPAWIRDGFLHELPRSFPAIEAVTWFSKDLSSDGQRDWRIETTAAATAAWREVVNSTLYGGSEPVAEPSAHQPTQKDEPSPLLARLATLLWDLVKTLVGAFGGTPGLDD